MAETHEQNGPANANAWSSEELFRGEKQVLIRHGDTLYRLIVTRQGKLILNK